MPCASESSTASDSAAKPPSIGLGILSWRAHKTLLASLETHRAGELFSLFDDCVIFFQEIENEDRVFARQFGLRAEGDKTNLGIMGGMKKIAELLNTDYVLHLENDFRLIVDHQTAQRQITTAVANMESRDAKFYRMAEGRPPIGDISELEKYSRYHPGSLLNRADSFSRKLRRFLRPAKARRLIGGSIYADANPHLLFPRHIHKTNDGHLIVDSAVLNWTNRAPFYPRHWFLEKIIPYAEANPSSRTVNGKPDLEKELNCRWWRNQSYLTGACDKGLFGHERLDRPENDEKGGHCRPVHAKT